MDDIGNCNKTKKGRNTIFKGNLVMKFLIQLILLIGFSSVQAEENYSRPVYLDESMKLFSYYPGGESAMARTGVVSIFLMVDKEGNTYEPMIERSNNHRFHKAALKAMDKAKFEPATLNGEAIDSATQFNMSFHMEFAWNSKRSSNKKFFQHQKSYFNELNKISPDKKKAAKYINKMTGTQHRFPYVQTSLSRSRYAFTKLFGNADDQIRAIREINISASGPRSRNLNALQGTKIFSTLYADSKSINLELIQLLINEGYYGEALHAYNALLYRYRGASEDRVIEMFADSMAEIDGILRSDKAFARNINLNQEGYTFLPLVKNSFAIDSIDGSIDTLKLRCTKKFMKLDFVKDSDFQIPKRWGQCQLQILGSKGSSARLIQQ